MRPCVQKDQSARLLYAVIAGLSALGPVASRASSVIDLRDGARTTFYGGRYTGTPPVGDFYGWAITFGDIDGDGYQDFISSSTNSEGPDDLHTDREHDVYVFFGRPRAEIDSLYAIDDPGVADIVIYRGGLALACADLDNDGYDDLVLAEEGGYVIFGAPRDQLRRVYDLDETFIGYTPPDVRILGSYDLGGGIKQEYPLSDFGVILALLTSDLNSDGFADIVIGDWQANTGRRAGGAVFIIFGRTRNTFPTVIDTDLSTSVPHPDVTIVGKSFDQYPFHMTVGDFDGDNIDDLVTLTVWGTGDEAILHSAGEIHGFFGTRDWSPVYDLQLGESDFSFLGVPNHILSNSYRLAAGDLDGDGRDDLITGFTVTQAGEGRNTGGEYRIFFGRPRGMWPRWGPVDKYTDVFIIGANSHDVNNSGTPADWRYPLSIATGNHDDDRYRDLVIGAGYGHGPPDCCNGFGYRAAGEAYVLHGRPRGLWAPFLDLREDYDCLYYGADAVPSPGFQFDLLGMTTAFGDVDGDGIDELFLSAIHGDGPNNFSSDVGEVYIFFGPDSTVVGAAPIRTAHARSVLFPNFPNPFRGTTSLRFSAPRDEMVSLTVYNARGSVVARPLMPERNASEQRVVDWRAIDDRGSPLASGVFFVRLRAGSETHAQKILLIR